MRKFVISNMRYRLICINTWVCSVFLLLPSLRTPSPYLPKYFGVFLVASFLLNFFKNNFFGIHVPAAYVRMG